MRSRATRADPNAFWDDFNVTGCTTLEYSGGGVAVGSLPDVQVAAGDRLTGCSGTVHVVHLPTNTLLYTGEFS